MASSLEIKIKLLTEGLAELTKLKTSLQETGTSAEGMGAAALASSKALTTLGNSVADAATAMQDTATSTESLATSLEGTAAASQTAIKSLSDISASGEEASTGLSKATLAAVEYATGLQGTATASATAATKMAQVAEASQEAANTLKKSAEEATAMAISLGGTDTAANDAAAALQESAKAAQVVATVYAKAAIAAADTATQLQDTATAATETAVSMAKLEQSAPGLQSIADSAQDAATSLKDLAKDSRTTADLLKYSADNAQDFADGLDGGSDAANDAAASLRKVADEAEATALSLESAATAAQDSADGFQQTATSAADAVNALNDISAADVAAELQAQATAAADDAAALQDVASAAELTANAQQDAASASQDAATALQDEASAAMEAAVNLQDLADAAADVAGELGTVEAIDLATQMQDTATAAIDAANGMQEEAKAAQDAASALQDAATAAQDAATSAQDTATAAQDAAISLQDEAASAQDAALASASAAAALNSLASAATGAAGSTQSAASGVSQIGSALSGISGGASAAGSGVADFTAVMGPAGAATDKFTSLITGAITAFTAFLAIKSIKETAEYTARIETLGITLGIVGKNAGYSAEDLAGFEKSVKGLGITTDAARESLTKMIQAGIPLGPQSEGSAANVTKLARAAQDLAVVTGENSSDTFKRLITNIQQMDTMGLRFMGITVDIQAAQEKWAMANNVTSASMTQQQKIMAVNNEVLVEATKLQGAYEASLESAGKKMASLTRYTDSLREALGDKLAPAYNQLADTATNMAINLEQVVKATDKSGQSAKDFGDAIGSMLRKIEDAVVSTAKFASENERMATSMSVNVAGMVSDMMDFLKIIGDAGEESGLWDGVMVALGATLAAVRDVVQIFLIGLEGLAATVVLATGAFYKMTAGILYFIPGCREAALAASETGDKFFDASQKMLGSMEGQINKFAEGNSALGNFANGVTSTSASLSDFGKSNNISEVGKELVKLSEASVQADLGSKNLAAAQKLVGAELQKMADSGKITESNIKDLTTAATAAGVEMPKAFKNPTDAIAEFSRKAKESKEILDNLGNATTFAGVSKEIQTLTMAQTNGTLSAKELTDKYKILTNEIDSLAKSGAITQKEAAKLNMELGTVGKAAADAWDMNLKNMGKTMSEFETGLSPKIQAISGQLDMMVVGIKATAKAYTEAFSDNLAVAKTVQDLNGFVTSIDLSRQKVVDLKAAGDEYGASQWANSAAQATAALSARFDELFEASLKSIKTKDDFDRVKKSIEEVGAATGKTAGEMAVYFDKAEQAVRKLDPAFVSAAKASKEIETALKDVDKQMSTLDSTITKVASQAEAAYSAMATGYGKLGSLVEKSASDQITSIDKRFNHESSLLDSSLAGTGTIEKQKTDLLIASTQEKITVLQNAFDKQQGYVDKQVEAETKALEAKMAGYKTDEVRISESLGKQADKQGEYQAALKDLDAKRKEAVSDHEVKVQEVKLASLDKLKNSYESHIDKLLGEEERLLGKIKDFAQQAEQAKMSAEEKIRSFQKSGMSDYEAYEATKSDITKAQSAARDAMSKGDFELAKTYLAQAKGMAGELNKEVKDGETVLVSKKQAIDNATNATKGNLDVELELNKVQKAGAESQLSAVQQQIQATTQMKDAVLEMIATLKESMGQKLELNIKANTDEARTKIEALNDLVSKKETLMSVKVDLEAANVALKKMMDDIAAGKPFKVDADVTKAEAALKKLGESTTDMKVKADVAAALASIETAKKAVENAGGKPIKVEADTKPATDGVAAVQSKVNELAAQKPTVTFDANVQALSDAYNKANADKAKLSEPAVAKVSVEGADKFGDAAASWRTAKEQIDGSPANGKLEVNADAAQKAADEWSKTGAKVTSNPAKGVVEVTGTEKVETDVQKVLSNLEAIGKARAAAEITTNAKSTHADLEYAKKLLADVNGVKSRADFDLNSNAKDKKAEIDDAMKQRDPANSKHDIETNAKEKKTEVDDAMKKVDDVTDNHNVATDAEAAKEKVDAAMESAGDVTDNHNVATDAEATVPQIEQAMTPLGDVTSNHNVETDAAEAQTEIDAAMASGGEVTSTHNVETNADEADAKIDQALGATDVTSNHNVDTNADEAKTKVDTALQTSDATSTLTVDAEVDTAIADINSLSDVQPEVFASVNSNAGEVAGEIAGIGDIQPVVYAEVDASDAETATSDIEAIGDIEATATADVDTSAAETKKSEIESSLNGLATVSKHDIETDAATEESTLDSILADTTGYHTIEPQADAVLGVIDDISHDTYSTHEIYVTKTNMFGLGGMLGFAEGGSVPTAPGHRSAPHLSEGTIPGAGNHDSVNRTLDPGSFVLRKSAVQQHGAGRLLEMISKAKSQPKIEQSPAHGRLNSILMPGEIVVGKDTVSRIGKARLSYLNGDITSDNRIPKLPMRFADGGPVGGAGFDFVASQLNFGAMGFAFEKGGPVPKGESAAGMMQVDLRSNGSKATVHASEDQTKGLLNVLSELKSRSM